MRTHARRGTVARQGDPQGPARASEHPLLALQGLVGNHAVAQLVQRAEYGEDNAPSGAEKDSDNSQSQNRPARPERRGLQSMEVDGDLVAAGGAWIGGSANIGKAITTSSFAGNHVNTRVIAGARIRIAGNVTASQQVVLKAAAIKIGQTASPNVQEVPAGSDVSDYAPDAADDLASLTGAGGEQTDSGDESGQPSETPTDGDTGTKLVQVVRLPGSLSATGSLTAPLVRVGSTSTVGTGIVGSSSAVSVSGDRVFISGGSIHIGGSVNAPYVVKQDT